MIRTRAASAALSCISSRMPRKPGKISLAQLVEIARLFLLLFFLRNELVWSFAVSALSFSMIVSFRFDLGEWGLWQNAQRNNEHWPQKRATIGWMNRRRQSLRIESRKLQDSDIYLDLPS